MWAGRRDTVSSLKRLYSLLLPYWPLAAFVALVTLATGGIELIPSLLLRQAVDVGIKNGDWPLITKLSLGVVAVAMVRGVLNYTQWYCADLLGLKVVSNLRQRLHDHLQTLSTSFINNISTGQLMSRLTGDVEHVQNFLGWGQTLFLAGVGGFFWVAGTLLIMDWKLALVTMITFPFLGYKVYTFQKQVRPAWEKTRESMGKLTTILQESFSGVRVVKAFARETYEIEKFRNGNESHLNDNLERAQIERVNNPVIDYLSGVSVILLVSYGGYRVMMNTMTIGTLIAFFNMIWGLIWPLRMLGWLVNYMSRALAAIPRVWEILDHEPDVQDEPDAAEIERAAGQVVFDHVTVERDGIAVLDDIDLTVARGEKIAILGATGSGKTTLVELLPRFFDPEKGRVLIDGVDIKNIKLTSLRRQVGMVLQDTYLFSMPLDQNIAYGRPDANPEQIEAAAALAQAKDFIAELPEKYETRVGERGIGLSGGQRQRVALARALVMDPPIIVLDEATASVDTETETLIQEGLEKACAGRTTFIIAKRLSTVKGADRIIFLDKGKIAEIGTPEELAQSGQLYRALRELQFGEEAVANG
jgi:ATP-binding cassette subfamily B protein